MHRSASSHTFRQYVHIPIHAGELQFRKKQLLSRKYDRQKRFPQTPSKQRKTPFRSTGTTFNRPTTLMKHFRSSSEMKLRDIGSKQNFDKTYDNIFIQTHKAYQIPIKHIGLKKLEDNIRQQNLISTRGYQTQRQLRNKVKFLKKGTSVNKAIIYNVLKSKYNTTFADSSHSYINYDNNRALSSAIYSQVPKGLKDVIGPQQMLRMSNIFTGGSISSINLHRKVKGIVRKYNEWKMEPQPQHQQRMTLRSIKRW